MMRENIPRIYNILTLTGSIFLLLWGLEGLLPIPHYRLFGVMGGISLFISSILLFQFPNNILPKYRGSLFKEIYFETTALHKQRLLVIMLVIMALVMMLLPPSDLSAGLISLAFGGCSFAIIIIWLKTVKYLEKHQKILIKKTLKFKAYFVLICSIIFMFCGFMLIMIGVS